MMIKYILDYKYTYTSIKNKFIKYLIKYLSDDSKIRIGEDINFESIQENIRLKRNLARAKTKRDKFAKMRHEQIDKQSRILSGHYHNIIERNDDRFIKINDELDRLAIMMKSGNINLKELLKSVRYMKEYVRQGRFFNND